jgi:anti-sigma regulatory factor (Ser/Thr protein kinase)
VVPLSRLLSSPAEHEMRWLRVEEPSAVAACRAAAMTMARRLEFPAKRADRLALAVTEAASNLHKHAHEGSVLLRISHDADPPGIELVTIDAGPGVPDVGAALRDGHSTSGTLGIGLGSISRQADFCDIYSAAGRGTSLVARFWPAPGGAPAIRLAGLTRPIIGEAECGDAYGAIRAGDALTGALCDGLGHGPLAAEAAMEALAAVFEEPASEPAAMLERAHRRMGKTRGGALAVVQINGSAVQFAGLGNIAAWIVGPDSRSGMASIPGIAGHQARRIRQFEYALPPGGIIVMHSDGLTSRWDIGALPGLAGRDPLITAAALLAEAGRHRDDAGVLVLKP